MKEFVLIDLTMNEIKSLFSTQSRDLYNATELLRRLRLEISRREFNQEHVSCRK